MLSKWVKNRLGGYRQELNFVDRTLPDAATAKRRVCVVGGGLAGISAAYALSKRGLQVDLFEKESYLGGKLGSWPYKEHQVSHGFHAFFKQYYNLRHFLEEIDCAKNLRSISDYQIRFKNKENFEFKDIETTPIKNLFSLAKNGLFSYREVLMNPRYAKMMDLLRYHPNKSFSKFDNKSFDSFSRKVGLSEKMKLMFITFARAFFAEPQEISMAELIKGFHFYFLSNDLGLLYDVLDDDFEFSLLAKVRKLFEEQGACLKLGSAVNKIEKNTNGFIINDQLYDYCVIASDSGATRRILLNSPSIDVPESTLKTMEPTGRYAVLRLWMDKIVGEEDPFFVFVERVKLLDSITFFHQMEKTSEEWARANQSGVYELHAYSIPNNMTLSEQDIRQHLLDDFFHYYPQLNEKHIRDEYIQIRSDFAPVSMGLNQQKQCVKSKHAGLYFAGDWVKMDNPTMLMEAAFTSGALAANEILGLEGIRQEQLYTVPRNGIFAQERKQ